MAAYVGLDMSLQKPSKTKNMAKDLCVGVQVLCAVYCVIR